MSELQVECESAKKRSRKALSNQSESSKIYFTETYGKRDVRLFEVPDSILNSILKGENLNIIGEDNDNAVLCTMESTFSIKKVETSNFVFLVPESDTLEFSIDAHSNDFYEVSLHNFFEIKLL